MKLDDEQIAALRDDLTKRLEIKADMLAMGERIAFGSDSAIMREAAEAIQALASEVLESRAALDVDDLTDIITDSIDIDWTPRDAAKAIVLCDPDTIRSLKQDEARRYARAALEAVLPMIRAQVGEEAAKVADGYHQRALAWARTVRGLEKHIDETDSSRIATAIRAMKGASHE